jgi:hypothetical protein
VRWQEILKQPEPLKIPKFAPAPRALTAEEEAAKEKEEEKRKKVEELMGQPAPAPPESGTSNPAIMFYPWSPERAEKIKAKPKHELDEVDFYHFELHKIYLEETEQNTKYIESTNRRLLVAAGEDGLGGRIFTPEAYGYAKGAKGKSGKLELYSPQSWSSKKLYILGYVNEFGEFNLRDKTVRKWAHDSNNELPKVIGIHAGPNVYSQQTVSGAAPSHIKGIEGFPPPKKIVYADDMQGWRI